MTEEQLKMFSRLRRTEAPALVDAWRKIHPKAIPTSLFVSTISSMAFAGDSITLAERKAAAGKAPVYMWNMTWETPVIIGAFGTPHTMEIPFMLDSWRRLPQFVGPAKGAANMEKQMAGAWVAFARTGKPDGPATPHWPAYDATTRR
jgi:para-nitrobenzyl esterase